MKPGQGYDTAVERADPAKLLYIFQLHVMAPLVLMQGVIPGMRTQGGGAIVNVSSGTTLMTIPNNGPYSGTKLAMKSLSLTGREELARDNILVSVVYPFMTDTPFEKGTMAFSDPDVMWKPNERASHSGAQELPPLDPPEFVAQIILEAIQSGVAEIFAHEWMARGRSDPGGLHES
ncbi:MAG: SDR family NAD(P)-dependent oxidoreductase [Actinobacteria bacterium]|nr:SDR family NAD(P)-dependent oxidoreductase [Actinomycetota bacterium]